MTTIRGNAFGHRDGQGMPSFTPAALLATIRPLRERIRAAAQNAGTPGFPDAAARKPARGDDALDPPEAGIVRLPSTTRDSGSGEPALGQELDALSEAEIAQLVSVALEGALMAASETNPEEFLQIRACAGRRATHDAMASLPRLQAVDGTVRAEYRKAIVFQNVALGLALDILDALRRYARAAESAGPPGRE